MSLNKPLYSFGVIIFVLLLSFSMYGCASLWLAVVVMGDHSVDFTQYERFTFVDFSNASDSKGKIIARDDFEGKKIFLELTEQKLKSMGFVRDDEKPDLAIWIGGLIEYEDRSYNTTSYEMIPDKTSYEENPIYIMREHKKDTIWTGYLKSIYISFFDVKNIPIDIETQEIFNLTTIVSARSWDNLNAKQKKRMLEIISRLCGKNVTGTNEINSIMQDLKDKLPLEESNRMWMGYASYFDETDYFKEDAMPFVIDTILDYYPQERKSKSVVRFLNKIPEWVE